MKKFTKLTVLSAMSAVTVFMPLGTTLADTKWSYGEDITKTMNNMKKEMGSMRKEMKMNFPSHRFNIHSSNDYSSRSVLEKHQPYYTSYNQHHHHVEHQRREHNNYHVERKTHRYVERKKITHRHIYEHHVTNNNNSGDALAAGILGLAAGAVLGNVLKKPEQPQIVYQGVPQVVYQQVPQSQIIYEVQSTARYKPLQQPWADDWLQYCKKKYRSFNPKTGTFRGYDGLEHICYAPLS
ncbi:BA14K family protein [Bartonella quintana]|uniref:BA14K family protein n=1 Tax=Bartonella quintana TaxID=803 RepID=UPI0002EFC1E0|nr:BA14K family protein [Bartonella quintana]